MYKYIYNMYLYIYNSIYIESATFSSPLIKSENQNIFLLTILVDIYRVFNIHKSECYLNASRSLKELMHQVIDN